MASDILSYYSPSKLKMTKGYYPFIEFSVQEIPKPNRNVKSGPEKMPAIAVDAYPFFAKAVIDR